jgi:uncharacterized protein
MKTKPKISMALVFVVASVPVVLAQTPGGPLANPAAVSAAAPAIAGQGPGFHDPRSPFKPIAAREGVVPWQTLSSVSTRTEKNRIVPIFPQPVQALNNQTVKLEGFMMPLEPGDKQRHFLLSAVPTTCSFCVPAGPEGLVEVRTRTPVRYTMDAVLLEGRMSVLNNDPYGLFYRIVDASPIQP